MTKPCGTEPGGKDVLTTNGYLARSAICDLESYGETACDSVRKLHTSVTGQGKERGGTKQAREDPSFVPCLQDLCQCEAVWC